MVGEVQNLQVAKHGQLSMVVGRMDTADRLGVDELESCQAVRAHLRQSGCVQLQGQSTSGYRHIEYLELGQRQCSLPLLSEVHFDVQLLKIDESFDDVQVQDAGKSADLKAF